MEKEKNAESRRRKKKVFIFAQSRSWVEMWKASVIFHLVDERARGCKDLAGSRGRASKILSY